MANESTYTQALLPELRRAGWIVDKLSDQFTAGIPDVAVTFNKTTVWLELKEIDKNYSEITKSRNYKLQMHENKKRAKWGRCYYVVHRQNVGVVEFWDPVELEQYLEKNEDASPWDGARARDWPTIIGIIEELAQL